MLKQIFDPSEQCGAQNPLVTLSKNFGQTNSQIAEQKNTFDGPISTNYTGKLLAEEYLEKVAQRMPAQNTFDMRKIIEGLPTEEKREGTTMEKSWEKAQRKAMALEWSEQFMQNNQRNWADEFEQTLTMSRGKAAESETEGGQNEGIVSSTWAKDFLEHYDCFSENGGAAMASEWEREFLTRAEGRGASERHSPNGEMSFFDYESAWEAMHSKETQEKYQFSRENPFVGEQRAREKAEETFREGRVADSILHYEAAVRREPQNVELWHSLGIALAENEDDPRAISALRNALKLDPSHKPSLLALSVSLANESFDHLALHELHKWICVHEKKEMPRDSSENTSLFRQYTQLDGTEFSKIEQQFLASAGLDQSDKAELQNAMGVLYNLARDFDRAVDCVRSALSFRPEDPVLWNRLGATLANADRAAEAINAYKSALHLFPAYVRARYNLGIACTNLNSYKDAAAHFVTALQLQNAPENSQIWSKLRSAMIRLTGDDEPSTDCFDALERRQLDRIVTFLRHKNTFERMDEQ
ncbi:hypothetical protein niasHT_004897 [Heterodera trifolii]|uniref:Peroxisomal targeting signal 1 receptor n=1 Tax=Heterodera trifolii TaxID=157864 RepID=A0ABD2M2Y4_9BILA